MENEKLIDANKYPCRSCGKTYCHQNCKKFIDWLENTAEAVKVVHGRWECTYDAERGETDVTCSHCKSTRTINGCYVTSTGESCYFEDNYCPDCGADMRERNANETV